MKNISLRKLLRELETDVVPTEEIFDTIIQKCPVSCDLMWNNLRFYRGVRVFLPDNKLNIFDPTTKDRSSRDSSNVSLYFTSKLSNKWKQHNIPDRTRSTFFTTMPDPGNYGPPYLCFLIGDPIVGHGKHNDNYDNYTDGFEKALPGIYASTMVEDIDSLVSNISRAMQLGDSWTDSTDPIQIKNGLLSIQEQFLEMAKDENLKRIDKTDPIVSQIAGGRDSAKANVVAFLNALLKRPILDIMEDMFSPETNGIVAKKLSELKNDSTCRGVEVWSASPYILLDRELEVPFLEYYEKKVMRG